MDMRIGYVIVGVKDLEKAVAFYRDVLGFALQYVEPQFQFASFEVGGQRFSLAAGADETHGAGDRNTGIGFVVADLDAVHAQLAVRGVQFTHGAGQAVLGRLYGDVRRSGRQHLLSGQRGMRRAQNVGHFAIECDDVERARAFYEAVFGWEIRPWGPPNYYHIVTGTPDHPGILGDLRERHHKLSGTGTSGYICTISVGDMKAVLAAPRPMAAASMRRPI